MQSARSVRGGYDGASSGLKPRGGIPVWADYSGLRGSGKDRWPETHDACWEEERVWVCGTVAEQYDYPIMQEGMTRYWYLCSCICRQAWRRGTRARVSAGLSRYTEEVYHLTKWVIDALKGA